MQITCIHCDSRFGSIQDFNVHYAGCKKADAPVRTTPEVDAAVTMMIQAIGQAVQEGLLVIGYDKREERIIMAHHNGTFSIEVYLNSGARQTPRQHGSLGRTLDMTQPIINPNLN